MTKNLFLLSLLLFTFSACNQKELVEKTPEQQTVVLENVNLSPEQKNEEIPPNIDDNKYYINEELGIKFAYFTSGFENKLKVENNRIISEYNDYIEVFEKNKNESIEQAILNLVKNKGKDINKCKVVNKGAFWGNKNYNEYVLDLVDTNIVYSKEELEEIKIADAEAKKDKGPFDGENKKQEIYNKRLVETCSDYAEPLGLGTSKTVPSHFVFNNKNKFVFFPGQIDASFYQEDSIEIIEKEESDLELKSDNDNYYISANLGIKFKLSKMLPTVDFESIIEKDNVISSERAGSSIYVFSKLENEKIEDAILKLIKQKINNEDINNCEIKKSNYNGYEEFIVNYKIPIEQFNFNNEEIDKIKLADKNPDGPIGGEWIREEIYYQYASKYCSIYANKFAQVFGNVFLYNESKSKTKFIYLSPSSGDAIFYDIDSIEIIED